MKRRLMGLMLGFVLCAGVLAGCGGSGQSEAPQVEPQETSEAPQPQNEAAAETGDGSAGEAPAAAGANGLLAIQSDETGLVQLDADPAYYMRAGDADDDAGTVGYYELVYDDGSGQVKSYGKLDLAYAVMYEYEGQLYLVDGETGIYLFDRETGKTSLWASKEGYAPGAGWYTDGEYLYTNLFVQDATGNGKECSIARIKWADGSVEELAGTDSFVIQGAWANTLFVTDWSLPTLTLSALDTGTGEIELIKEMPQGFEGTLLDGVYYTTRLEDGGVVLVGENLLTGETGSLPLGIKAEETMVLGYSEGRVWLYIVADGEFSDIGVDPKTGDIMEGEG